MISLRTYKNYIMYEKFNIIILKLKKKINQVFIKECYQWK